MRHQLLEAYLFLGGINTGAKMFGGVDQKFVKDKTAEEVARYTATDYVPEKMHKIGMERFEDLDDDYEEPEYVVDFNYIVRGFLYATSKTLETYMEFFLLTLHVCL